MSQIESLIEVVLEIGNFTFATDGVDGHYNVRITPYIKKSNRHRIAWDVLLTGSEVQEGCSFPAGTNSGTGVSKTCYLKPHERRVHYGDTFSFRIHLLEYLHLLRQVYETFTFTFKVEVYRSPVACKGNYYDKFQCISSRTLVLNFDPTNVLCSHVPLMMCFGPVTLLNITLFAALVYICPPIPRLAPWSKTPCQFEDILFAYVRNKKADEGLRVSCARLVLREMCYLMLNVLGNIHIAALGMFQVLHPLDDADVFDKISAKDTFTKIQSVSQVVSSERAFVEFARGTVATLCCLNALLWEAFLRLVVGRTRAKRFLCSEYYRKKAEHFQELYFSCEKNRCSCVLTSQDCLTGSYRPLSRAIRELQFPAMIPPLEVFCPEVDECPTRPVIIFEEQYDCFSDICPLCGISNHDAGSEAHVGGQSSVAHGTGVANAAVHTPHRTADNANPLLYCTPMLFTDSTVEDAEAAPVRNKPVESDKSAHKRFLKLKNRISVYKGTDWIMPEPEFVGLADRTLVFRQLQGSCESIGAVYRSSEPIHFVVFVNGLGGKSSDFFWAKRWMKLLIGAPKHILIWSQANEEQTFHEISVCGLRLAVEVASYLDNIGTTDFKLSFIGFSLGCVIVRAALTCPQMRPYVKNLHTFFSINGPHLGVAYVKNRFLRFQISVLSKIHMKSSLKELTLQDSPDLRRCYLYILSQAPGLEYFKNVLLVGSSQDKLVPVNSSNIQHCSASVADKTVVGKTYDEMVKNLLGPLLKREDINLRRFDIFYDTGRLRYLEPVFPSLSHVCALMSRNLFEKFMLLSAAECFK
ncbi:uncharacterized protein LOC142771612 isoform X2 [Rhipicephalus microplus]|uniref:uncharacterized protein LOC142771612 isoform X2 n=1 Tax=Rhipicephalus microplus TaxID=6941 RepID=UPI003F6D2EC4